MSVGIRKTSALVNVIAAGTPTLVYTLTQGRTAKIKKIMLFNNTANNDEVTFGQGAGVAFAASMPAVLVLAGFDEQLSEWEVPQFEFVTNIYVSCNSAGLAALTPESVQIEVEDIG